MRRTTTTTTQPSAKRRSDQLKKNDDKEHDVNDNNQKYEGGRGGLLDQSQVEDDENQPRSLTNSPLRKKASNSSNNKSPFGRSSQLSNSLNNLHNNNSNNNESLVPSPPAFAAGLSSKFSTTTNTGVSSLSVFSGVDITELQSNHFGNDVSLSLFTEVVTTELQSDHFADSTAAQSLALQSNNVSTTLSSLASALSATDIGSGIYFDEFDEFDTGGTTKSTTKYGKFLTTGTIDSINGIVENYVTADGRPKLRSIDRSRVKPLPTKGSKERRRLVLMASIKRHRSTVGGNQPPVREEGYPPPPSIVIQNNSINRPHGLNPKPCVFSLVRDPDAPDEILFKAAVMNDENKAPKELSIRFRIGVWDKDDEGKLVLITVDHLKKCWAKRRPVRGAFLIEPNVGYDAWKKAVVKSENKVK